MTEEKTDFSELITDKDGDYSKARFMSLAEELSNEGRRPDRVFLAMYRAASSASLQHSIAAHHDLVRLIHDAVIEWLPELETQMKDMIEAQNRANPID